MEIIKEAVKGLFVGFGMIAAFIIVAEWDNLMGKIYE